MMLILLTIIGCGAATHQGATDSSTGSSSGTVGSAQATLGVTSLAFGPVLVGAASPAQTVTLTNSGTAPLSISSINSSDTLDFDVSNTCGAQVAAAASCSITVVFHPQAQTTVQATLTVVDDSGGTANARQTVVLSGTGTPQPLPQASLSAATLAFPLTAINSTSVAQTVTLTNSGTAPLSISSINSSDAADFGVTSTCGTQVAAAGNCSVSVVFHPQAQTAVQATLTLTDDSGGAAGAKQTVALSGTGTPPPLPQASLSTAALTFPLTAIGSSSPEQMVTLTNGGTAPLSISGIVLAGAQAGEFRLAGDGTCGSSLAVAASCIAGVIYQPSIVSRPATASLVIADNAGGAPGTQQTIALTGSSQLAVDTVAHFGDSITCGYYAQPNDGSGNIYSQEGYAGLFDSWLGISAQNNCRAGDMAADMSRWFVVPNAQPTATGNQLYTVMIGTNDAYVCGITQRCLNNYLQALGASLAWLSIPDSDKVLAFSISNRTGAWISDGDVGLASSDPTASLTFNAHQAIAGRDLFVVYHVFDAAGGALTVTVDGNNMASLDSSSGSGFNAPTQNETWDTFFLARVPLVAVGDHKVVITNSAAPNTVISLIWAGVPQQSYLNQPGAPRVLLGQVPMSYSYPQTAAAQVYNAQLDQLVQQFTQDGLFIVEVPTFNALVMDTDFFDILHPNNLGHAHLAAAFEAAR